MRRVWRIVALGALWPVTLVAQTVVAWPTVVGSGRLTFTLEGSAVQAASLAPTGVRSEFRGTVFGGTGQIAVRKFSLELGYRQGSLDPARDVVEASALLGVQAAPWLAVRVGPHVRTYVTPAVTERWVFWALWLRTDQALVGPEVRVHAEAWRAISGSVSAPQGFDRGQGAEMGLTLRSSRRPWWVRLAYGIDDAWLGDGARRETVDQVSLVVGWGR